ncbi:MAG: histidine ammonia-lyase [Gemmatimonadetes bacterium]|nr:histidine ammonia-lyase [Gemmatimonadota bacterium]NNM33085.1 histidine ammonia-lyase [Gemmatimonadota bacterium]
MEPLRLDGASLTIQAIDQVAAGGHPVALAPRARADMVRSRDLVARLLASEAKIYGVTTGFGRLASVVISADQQRDLQRNLVRSHSAGFGAPLSDTEVRAVMLLRANALARGHSGCRPEVVETLVAFLNEGLIPVVPELGSVGASGDLAPLAHVALNLIGEGRVRVAGATVPAEEAMARAGIRPLELEEKEGLALINGTQATTGLGALALGRLSVLADVADTVGAISLEGLTGSPDPFRPAIHAARPHPGQIESAARLWALLQDSEIRDSHREGDHRVQDPYSLRCMPQVHGAAREALRYASDIVTREANSTTDNPLVLPEEDLVVSGGNFHAQIVAQALDLAAIAVADLASISERRVERLLNPDLSGLPAFLTPEPGIRSGFMIAQVAAVDALAEMRVLAHPASVDSVPTSAAQEDHVSMGLASARKLRRSVDLLEAVLAIELLCGVQALEYRRPLRSSGPVESVVSAVREVVPALDEDRVLSDDIALARRIVAGGALRFPHLTPPA